MSSLSIEQFKNSPLFATLQPAALEALVSAGRVENLPRHDVLFEAGDHAERIMLVISGAVKLTFMLVNGREVIVDLVGPGDLVGDDAVCEDRRDTGASVLREATFVSLPAAAVKSALSQNTDFAVAWIGRSIKKRRRLQARIPELAYGNIEDRLLRMLKQIGTLHGSTNEDGEVELRFPLTHQELSELIGATRETTTLAMGRLRATGQIKFVERRIVLKGATAHGAHSKRKAG